MILMIHGAGATSVGFNYLSLWLDQELQFIDYRVGDDHDTIFKKIQFCYRSQLWRFVSN